MNPFTDHLVDRLARAERVAVLTGAGISAESGIATFRDPDGLWERFRPEELASMDGFLRNPERVQDWYRYRREVVLAARPNAGHTALAAFEQQQPVFTLITQNVDNLHQRAGSRRVVELHGNLLRNYCVDCGTAAGSGAEVPMTCGACGGRIRPDVVWFGEMLPPEAFEAATRAAETADVFLSIGTSAEVYPAAGLPLLARRCGAYVAEVNVAPSAIAADVDEVVLGPAGTVLPRLLEAVTAARTSPEPDRR